MQEQESGAADCGVLRRHVKEELSDHRITAEPIDITPRNLPDYLRARGLVKDAATLHVRELGGGVSNVVLRAEWTGTLSRTWIVKQSLGKLRVESDWRSDRRRIFREAEAIAALGGVLGATSLPQIVYVDRDNFLFIMTAAPAGSEPWKSALMAGEVDLRVARRAAQLLTGLIEAGSRSPELRERFGDRTVFDELRLDPYYRATAARHPELRSAYEALIEDNVRTSLVHGDFSPKNMLVKDGDVCLIDFEAVNWGDPAFDAGFLLNHLFLKAAHQARYRPLYFAAAREFWREFAQGAPRDQAFEAMTVRHLGGLMMARIDGKSPVEYIRDEDTKARVRALARRILLEPARTLEDALSMTETSG